MVFPMQRANPISTLCPVTRSTPLPVPPRFFERALPVWVDDPGGSMNTALGVFWDIPACAGRLRITSSGRFRVSVNGAFFCHGPERAAHGFARVEEWDLEAALTRPLNRVAIEVVSPGIASYYTIKEPPFVQAEISTPGGVVAFTAPGTCGATALPHRLQRVHRYSFQRSFSEVCRENPSSHAWRTRGPAPTPLALQTVPAPDLLPRRAPLPEFPLYEARLVEWFRFVRREPAALWNPRFIAGIGSVSEGFAENELDSAPLRKWEECGGFEPVDARPLLDSGYGVTLDLGSNRTGFPRIRLKVLEGCEILVAFDEIRAECRVLFERLYAVNLLSWTLEAGEYELEAFEPYTLRYLQLLVTKGRAEFLGAELRGYEAAIPAPSSGQDPALDKIAQAAWSTLRQNAADLLLDCPSRERAGWLCDSFFSARAAQLLSGSTAFEEAFLENYLLCPDPLPHIPSGMFPMCYPADHPDGVFIPQWSLWLILEVADYAQRGGDRRLAEAFRPRFGRLLEWFAGFENEEGLLENLPGWQFIEHSRANELTDGVNFPTNWLYAAALDAMAGLAGDDQLHLRARHVRETTTRLSWNGGWFVDHAVRQEGELRPTPDATETCQYYAFYFDAVSPRTHPELWEMLLSGFGPAPSAKGAATLSPANFLLGFSLRFELLARNHCGDLLREEAKAYLGPMANLTGTLWEHNDARASCCHAFAAHILNSLHAIVD